MSLHEILNNISTQKYHVIEKFISQDDIDTILNDLKSSQFAANDLMLNDYISSNFSVDKRYDFRLQKNEVPYSDNLEKIRKQCNELFKNIIKIEHPEKQQKKFNVDCTMNLNVIEPYAPESEIVKTEQFNIFIPIEKSDSSLISVFSEETNTGENIENDLLSPVVFNNYFTNYGKLDDLDYNTKTLISDVRIDIPLNIGDALIVNRDILSVGVENFTDLRKYSIQILY